MCFGCRKVGHIRRNCPTNPLTREAEEEIRKRKRQGHSGETPRGKAPRVDNKPKVFLQPTISWTQMAMVFVRKDGALVSREQAECLERGLTRWMINSSLEGDNPPRVDKVNKLDDGVEFVMASAADAEKFQKAFEIGKGEATRLFKI